VKTNQSKKKIMKQILLLSFILVLTGLTVSAQENSPIVLKKKVAYQNDKKLTSTDLKSILLSKPESAAEYKIAKNKSSIAMVPMMAGTVCILYGSIVMVKQSADEAKGLSNDKVVTSDQSKFVVPCLLGACLVLVSIPFVVQSQKHMQKAIENYNSHSKTGYRPVMNFSIRGNGAALTYKF
jgi:hypothetical protein